MMCDVMPTISEDGANDRESQGSGEDPNLEQLMVSLLDERDKLMEGLREKQEALELVEVKLIEANKDREMMQKQLQQTTPQVHYHVVYIYFIGEAYFVYKLVTNYEHVFFYFK